MEDDAVPTPEQRFQDVAGTQLALKVWVGALIATHPDKAMLQVAVDRLAAMTESILLRGVVLQADDGLRAAYSGEMRGMRELLNL